MIKALNRQGREGKIKRNKRDINRKGRSQIITNFR
jgi:hypothetical protein